MADSLETRLQKLRVDQPDLPKCFPSLNPFDAYRIDIANTLSELSGVQPKTVYSLPPDMSGKRINNYRFNIATMTSFEGDTASEIESANLDLLAEPHAINFVRLIAQFPDTIQITVKTLEPTTILMYLFRLTRAINSSYDVLQVVGSERELMTAYSTLRDKGIWRVLRTRPEHFLKLCADAFSLEYVRELLLGGGVALFGCEAAGGGCLVGLRLDVVEDRSGDAATDSFSPMLEAAGVSGGRE